MGRSARIVLVLIMTAVLALSAGCKTAPDAQRSPVVEAPAIGKSGVLRAGIDLSTAPYGGVDQGREAGIDVDVAAALADRLGVELEIVDVAPSQATTALAQGDVDIVLSVPFAETAATGLSSAGTYLSQAPGFFVSVDGTASVEPSLTIETLTADKIAVQAESPAYWALRYELGEGALQPFDSLKAALEAVSKGEAEVAAGDALVGIYLTRQVDGIAFAGQVEPAGLLAVVTSESNVELADIVRKTLDELAADGVLDTIRTKWLGGLPDLVGIEDGETDTEP